MQLYHFLPPEHAFLPFVEVDGEPRVGELQGRLSVPGDAVGIRWLTASFRRTLCERPFRIRGLVDGGAALGLLISKQASASVARSIIRTERWIQLGREPSTALIDEDGMVLAHSGASIPDGLRDVMRRVVETGSEELCEGVWVRGEQLHGPCGRVDRLVRLEPVERLRLPSFTYLTESQIEVCELAAQGLGVHDIATARACRPETVRTHLRSVYHRLGVSSRAELVPVVTEFELWRTQVMSQLRERLRCATLQLGTASS